VLLDHPDLGVARISRRRSFFAMVLDGVSALGLASSIVQIVDFSVRLFSKTREYHKSDDGSLINQQALGQVAGRLHNLGKRLGDSLSAIEHTNEPMNEQSALSIEEIELKSIASQCRDNAHELSSILEDLRINGRNTRWKSFRHALKSYWRKEEIEDALKSMNMMREQMVVYLLVILKYVLVSDLVHSTLMPLRQQSPRL
jgi:hypothetical protein